MNSGTFLWTPQESRVESQFPALCGSEKSLCLFIFVRVGSMAIVSKLSGFRGGLCLRPVFLACSFTNCRGTPAEFSILLQCRLLLGRLSREEYCLGYRPLFQESAYLSRLLRLSSCCSTFCAISSIALFIAQSQRVSSSFGSLCRCA